MIRKLYLTIAAIALLAAAGFAEEPVITMTTTTQGVPFNISISGIVGNSATVDFGVGDPVTKTFTNDYPVTFTSTASLTAAITEIKVYGSGIISLSVERRSLTSLEVGKCPTLKSLYCYDNKLTSLDVSQNISLSKLHCNDNKLTSLKINMGSSFSELYCHKNELDFGTLPFKTIQIKSYSYAPQAVIRLPKQKYAVGEAIDLSRYAVNYINPTVFTWKTIDGKTLVAGVDYTVSHGVFTFTRSIGEVFCELTNADFPDLVGWNLPVIAKVIVGEIPFAFSMTTTQKGKPFDFNIYGIPGCTVTVDFGVGNPVTKTLAGLPDDDPTTFTSTANLTADATEIKVYGVGITGLAVSYNKELTSIDVSRLLSLKNLMCHDNKLTSLDVSKNTALLYLNCDANELTSLDVSKNAALIVFSCSGNKLTSLDVSNNLALKSLSCNYNKLSSLDVSQNTLLYSLRCNDNKLTSLKMKSSSSFSYLECFNNMLDFTMLPTPASSMKSYGYAPQAIVLPKQKYALGETVDLSRYASVTDASGAVKPTVFTWKSITGETLVSGTDYTESNGQFIFKKGGYLSCELFNPVLPDFAGEKMLKVTEVQVGEFPLAVTMTTTSKGSFSVNLCGLKGSPITVDFGTGGMLTKSFDGVNYSYNGVPFTSKDALTADATEVKVYGWGITSLWINYRDITALDVSKCASLQKLDCSNNSISALDLSSNTNLVDVKINGNSLTLATLPQLKRQWKNISYNGQRALKLPKASYAVGEAIDLSSQLSAKDVDGNVQTTIYSWYNSKDEMLSPINDYTESNGVFTFKRAIADKVYCHMSNHAYPDFDKNMYDWFKTEPIKVYSTTGINDGTADAVKVYVSNGSVIIEGLRGGVAISMVNMLGSVVHQSVAGGNSVTIPLPVHGLYVVKVGISAHKVAW